MRKLLGLAVPAALLASGNLLAQTGDEALRFFEEEAQVVTASRRPQTLLEAPATVYVVTSEDIKASGARTLWDALRAVPGVDVMAARTFQGEVSIRGLNKPLQNRTLVLLDGRTVLNGYFDFTVWESLPVSLEEIDRVEIVEGPASALYGANAVNGVINIITKSPEKLEGSRAFYTGGERNTQMGSFLHGSRKGKASYKLGAGLSQTNRFEDAKERASQAGKFHALFNYSLSRDSQLSLSGGLSDIKTQLTTGGAGKTVADGLTSFLKADYRLPQTHLRFFWNRGRTTAKDFNALNEPNLDYDTYDANLEHSLSLPFSNKLVVGAGYRRNTLQSKIFPPGLISQDLWSLFFEDDWRPSKRWAALLSGRLDRHPLAGLVFSPRGSLMFYPKPGHVLRLSGGTSFRNPTLLENYLQLTQTSPNPGPSPPNPPFTSVESTVQGNQDLDPERMAILELAYNARLGPLKVTIAGYHYRLSDIIDTGPTETVSTVPPAFKVRRSFTNRGKTKAWGGELGGEYLLSQKASLFANYSYQSLSDELSAQTSARSAPRHKVNGGIRYKEGGLSAGLWAHWVDKTFWNKNPISTDAVAYEKVAGYYLLNAGVGWEFSGRLEGLEAAVSAFNLTNNEHFEVLPAQSSSQPGQNGEIIKGRWTGTLTYRF